MQEGTTTRSLSSLFSDLTRETSQLIRQEIALARAEIGEKISQAGIGVASLVAGGMIILIGLFFLAEALVFGVAALLQLVVSEVVAAWLAPLLVGLLAVLIGWAVMSKGRRNLQARALTPQRTIGSIRQDEEMVREQMR